MLQLNFANMMREVIGSKGLSEKVLESLRVKVRDVHQEISGRKYRGLDFLDLPDRDPSTIRDVARMIREDSDNFLVLGIGGSALGPKAILEALSPFHNLRKGPKVFIYDNVDPKTLESLLSMIDLKRTTVNVISKSGSTAETAASFMILWEEMKKLLGDKAAGRFVATTDPESGNLRKIAAETGMRTLPIEEGIGGRYSVLSPVGLLLAEVIGAESAELLAGAAEMRRRCAAAGIWENPAYIFGTLLFLMDRDEKRNINVLVPYADSLRPMSEWFCQLWSESLGKDGKGMTPYPSVGTTDQHSQMQLWMEGPEDKVVIFVRIVDYGADFLMSKAFGEVEGISYLSGRNLSELIKAEEESTELALAKKGRPSMTLTIPCIDAFHTGQLFMFFEVATAFTGMLMGINPFDQPGVEESKRYTYGMMGKKGFASQVADIELARKKKASRNI